MSIHSHNFIIGERCGCERNIGIWKEGDSEIGRTGEPSIEAWGEEHVERNGLTHSQGLRNKFGVRGVTRGATLGLCVVNMVGGGLAYTFGKREDKEE